MVCSVLTVIGGGDTATCCAKYGTEDKVPVCVRVLCVCVCVYLYVRVVCMHEDTCIHADTDADTHGH